VTDDQQQVHALRSLPLAGKLEVLYAMRSQRDGVRLTDPGVAKAINVMVRERHEKNEAARRQQAERDGTPYDQEEADARLRASTISPAYIWQLRCGKKDNPTIRHLMAIADWFGVEPSLLLPPGREHPDGQLEPLQALSRADVVRLALRAQDLSPGHLGMIRELVEQARKLEGLEDDEPSTP
jgi:transcriptional regulator with XRE-family HTH domain